MDITQVNTLLNRCTGNFSVIYPLIKHDLSDYTYVDIPFAEEFLFFEDNYLLSLKFILENNIEDRSIIDIGCEFGIQSVIFEGFTYEGIDIIKNNFFEKPGLLNSFRVGDFLDMTDIDLSDKIVISSMSLGFFEKDSIGNSTELSNTQKLMIEKLSNSKHLFIASTDLYIGALSSLFKTKLQLSFDAYRTHLYYFTNV